MFKYGKMTQHAVAAMSRLAELYADPACKASSGGIGKDCGISQPLVAKILSTLTQGGLVSGAPGPGGGYRLALPPKEISIFMIARLFERDMESMRCPFGRAWCNCGTPCPVHNQLVLLTEQVEAFLRSTTLDVFANRDALDKRVAKAAKGKGKVKACRIA